MNLTSVQPTCKRFTKGIGHDKVHLLGTCPRLVGFNVIIRLFADLVGDSLTEFSYNADLAGLSYNYTSHSFGTYLVIGGYNDKLPLLLRHIFEKIKGLKVESDRLDVVKEQVRICVLLPGL